MHPTTNTTIDQNPKKNVYTQTRYPGGNPFILTKIRNDIDLEIQQASFFSIASFRMYYKR